MLKQYVQQYWTQNEAVIFRFMDECAARGETKVLFSFTLVPNDAPVIASKELGTARSVIAPECVGVSNALPQRVRCSRFK